MVNFAAFNSNFGEWMKRSPSDTFMLLHKDLTLMKLADFEDFLVMDVVKHLDNGDEVRAEEQRKILCLCMCTRKLKSELDL